MVLRIAVACFFLTALLAGANSSPQSRKVQVGYCLALRDLDAAEKAGFDYLELRTSEIAALPDAEFEQLVARLKKAGIKVPVTYLFLPPTLKVTGPAVNEREQMAYVRKALDRMARLGAEVVTFGSGGARTVPDGFPKEQAFAQLVSFCKRIGPEARARKITIAIEPLRKQECNLINTLAEGLDLIRAVDDPNIQLMVDFYHMAEEKEDPAIILKAREHIRHFHMANPAGRVFPLKWEEYDYAALFENFRKIGYNKRVSIEARSADFPKEAPLAIEFLRQAFAPR